MFQISTNKQYDGVVGQDKYSPQKKIRDPNKFISKFNAVSPKDAMEKGYWQSFHEEPGP